MATAPWSIAEEYLRSLTGIDSFNSTEKAFLKSGFNRHVRMAYEESRYWPRYVKEELRYASFDNIIPQTESGKTDIDTFIDIYNVNPRNRGTNVKRYDWISRHNGAKVLGQSDGDYQDSQYQASASTISGSEVENISDTISDTVQSMSFWMKMPAGASKGSGTDNLKLIWLNADGGSGFVSGDSYANILFTVRSVGTGIEARNGWVESEGTQMFVYVDGQYVGIDYGNGDAGIDLDAYDDGNWHHYIWTLRPTATTPQNLGSFYWEKDSDSDQTHELTFDIADVRVYADKIDSGKASLLYNNPESTPIIPVWSSAIPQYWVTYKGALTTAYGDGANEDPNIPLEFFEYGVHGAYADWLRSEGQTDKARVEEAFAREHLERQLEKVTANNGSPYIWSRFSNHANRQVR